MTEVIQFSIQFESEQMDVEATPEMTVEGVCRAAGQYRKWILNPAWKDDTLNFICFPDDRRLHGGDTLLQARIWNGNLIEVKPGGRTGSRTPLSSEARKAVSRTPPAVEMKPIVPLEEQPASAPVEGKANGYTWKQIDSK